MPLYYSEREQQLNVANIKTFGADSTGTTSCATAFAAAVASLPASGGVVYFPAGTYLGELTLTSKNNITIIGDGKFTKLIGGGAGYNCLQITSCTFIEIRDIWFYGSGSSAAANTHKDNCIDVVSTTDLVIERCRFTNHGLCGIAAFNCLRVKIDGNVFYDAVGFVSGIGGNSSDIFIGDGGATTLLDYIITNNICKSGNNVGILIQPTTNLDHRRFVISGNLCSSHLLYGICCYVFMNASGDTTISEMSFSNNVCESNNWSGLYLNSVTNSSVVGNSTRANQASGVANGLSGGIHINGCSNIIVNANAVMNEASYGISVNGHSLYSSRRDGISIIGNSIGNQTNANYPAIFIGSGMIEASISDNQIRNELPTAIYIQGTGGAAKKFIISNNSINGVAVSSTSRGIDLDGQYISAIVTGNKVTNYFVGLRISDGNALIIKDNILTGNTFDVMKNGEIDDLRMFDNIYASEFSSLSAVLPTITGATPSIISKHLVRTSNGSATTVTNLTGGTPNQVLQVVVDSNTTIQNNANIKLDNTLNFSPPSGGTLSLINYSGVWYETARATF